MRTRVIPVLQLHGGRLVKTRRFRDPVYVGDPINAVRIFNDKEVDELAVVDIGATVQGRGPDLDHLRRIADEAFMPMAYGGGLTSLGQMRAVFAIGFEKVILGTAAVTDPGLVAQAAREFGSQSVVVAIDVAARGLLRRRPCVFTRGGSAGSDLDPLSHAQAMVAAGAGELLVTAIARDGAMTGYDLALVRELAAAVPIPVVALGGAGGIADLAAAADAGAAAVAAGSLFVFHGPHRAVLITYPDRAALERLLP